MTRPSAETIPSVTPFEEAPRRIVAIADIHGEAGLFHDLVTGLDRASLTGGAAVYLLGDFVDRGPDSRAVLDLAQAILAERPGSRALLGNHDEWFRSFLQGGLDADGLANWLAQGGAQTLSSYGIAPDATAGEALRHVRDAAPGHLPFLEAMETIVTIGEFAFVHAGVDPARPIADQDPHDCVWIRGAFMRHVGRLSHVVVHGHTPQKRQRPTVTENRVSIDTGACFTGTLTAAVIDREERTLDFFSLTRRDGLFSTAAQRLDRGFGTVLDRYGPARKGSA